MFDDLIKEALKGLRQWLGERHYREVLAFLLAAGITVFIVSRSTTKIEFLGVTIWAVIALWYVWLFYRPQLAAKLRLPYFVVVLLASIDWLFCLVLYLTSSERRLASLVRLGESLAEKGIHVDAANKFGDAVAYAQKSAQTAGELECRCKLGQYQTFLGRATDARIN